MIGQSIAHYRVTEKLGAGGMGEVYRATDTKLGRDVALKVLPEAFATDPDRIARFQREAQVLASLNHPHIAAIHGLEEAGGHRFLILELVEGETLAEKIARGPLPLEETLHIARQMADALEAAHEAGVIHRDLKPGNVKVTPAGQVKLLDFGLAKAFEGDQPAAALGTSPTLTAAATRAGVILGTAAYMSPEQARAKPVDRRADIWAFGVVVLELLTGKSTFEGETVSDTLASVLKSELDWSRLPADTPSSIRRLLRRCLERDPRQRLRDIGDARLVIEETLRGAPEESVAVAAAPAASPRRSLPLAAALMVAAALLAGGLSWMLKPAPETPLRKFELRIEALEGEAVPVISPDGRRVAYRSGRRVWIRDLNQIEPRALPGSEGAFHFFWSPDSASLGYVLGNKLWRASVASGESTAICDAGRFVAAGGAAWAPDGTIIYARGNTGIFRVSAQGGDPAILLAPDLTKESDFHQPHLLPGGRGVVFVTHRNEGVDTLEVLAAGKRKVLLQLPGQHLGRPVYSPSGHLLFHRSPGNPGLWALSFSLSKLAATGEPFLVVPDSDLPSVSSDGTLTYVRGADTARPQLAWADREGKVGGLIGQPQPQLFYPALSPDGRRVAVHSNESQNVDIWIHDIERGTRTRLTFGEEPEEEPTWLPSGKAIIYEKRNRPNSTLMRKPADGTGEAEALTTGLWPSASPDGKHLIYSLWDPQTDYDLWYMPLEGERKPVPFLRAPGVQRFAQISPNGRYVAYLSEESGREEVYLKPFQGGDGKWQVSVAGGFRPRWSRSGDSLYYIENENLMEVEVSTRPALTLGSPRLVFAADPSLLDMGRGFDVFADGRRFVVVQTASHLSSNASITVVQNWYAEFKGKK